MANLRNSSFEDQVQDFTAGLVSAVTALAPLFLMLIIFGIAGANAYIEFLFQLDVFGSYALAPAVLVGGFRFASGMGGITLMKRRAFIVGGFFFLVSLLLTMYTWWHSATIAASIAPAAVEQAKVTISVIVWGGLIGEAMIASYMAVTEGNGFKAVTWWKTSANGQSAQQPAASANGNGRHQ